MKYLTIAVMRLAILVVSHLISRVESDGSWVCMYNESGKKYHTLSANSVGNVIGVAGNTFTSRNGNWIYTWDKNGKRLNTRSAR